MSWIHACIGPSITQELTPGSPKPLRVFTLPRGYIALGGIPETCLYDGDENKGWAVVGLGIEVTETESQLVDKEGWRRILSRDTPWHTSLNGHFAAIRWDGDRIDCFTDELGQRTLFFSRSHRGLCISPRPGDENNWQHGHRLLRSRGQMADVQPAGVRLMYRRRQQARSPRACRIQGRRARHIREHAMAAGIWS